MRILVLGGNGMLGSALVKHLPQIGWEVQSTTREEGYDACANVPIFERLFTRYRPEWVVNAIGAIKQRNPSALEAIEVNAAFPHRIAALCHDIDARMIHVSTDCVFNGLLPTKFRYSERYRPNATDLYGRSKTLGEVDAPHCLTLRTSLIGLEGTRKLGLIEWFLAKAKEKAIPGFQSHIFSGVTCEAFAVITKQLIAQQCPLSGVYHLSSDPIDKCTLLRMLATQLPELRATVVATDAPRVNRALSSLRLRKALPWLQVPSWEAMISDLARAIKERGTQCKS